MKDRLLKVQIIEIEVLLQIILFLLEIKIVAYYLNRTVSSFTLPTFWSSISVICNFVASLDWSVLIVIIHLDSFIFRVFVVLLVPGCIWSYIALDGVQAYSDSSWSLSICQLEKNNCKIGQTSQGYMFSHVLTIGIKSG